MALDVISKVINSMLVLIVILGIMAIPLCDSLILEIENVRARRILNTLKFPFGLVIFVVLFTTYLLKELKKFEE